MIYSRNFSGKSPIKNMEDAKEKLDFYCERQSVPSISILKASRAGQ